MSFAPAWSGPTGRPDIQGQRERWENSRRLAAGELLQSERRYCQQLELVTTVGAAATLSALAAMARTTAAPPAGS